MTNTLLPLINKFLSNLKEHKQRSSQTIRNYRLYLERFSAWLEKEVRRAPMVSDILPHTTEKFRRFLGQQKLSGLKLSSATQNYHLIALRSFLNFLQEQKINSLNPKAVKLEKQKTHNLLTIKPVELTKLLEAPLRANESELIKLRDRALLELICSTGLKVSGLIRLTQHNLSKDGSVISLLLKNATTKKTFPLSNQTQYHLKNYLALRRDKNPALFVRHDRANKIKATPLTARSIQRILERYRKAAGLKNKITPSALRHTYALSLIDKGMDIKAVQELLGHKHLSTTRIYQS